MTPLENVLSRLEKVRKGHDGQYMTLCPAHDDKGPSLSLRETPEGAVLLHCFAGCEVADVVANMGLELHDLYPASERPPGTPKRLARLLTDRQALNLLADEATLVAVAAGNVGHGLVLSSVDKDSVLKAAGYINYVRHAAMGSPS
jgi:hypothetical protein